MKKTWEVKKLGEIMTLKYGKALAKEKRSPTGKFPVYGANGIKDRTDEILYDKKTIIIGRKGSAGEINLSEEKFWALDVTYYVDFDEKKYDLMYLFYLLKLNNLTFLAKGVKPGINRNDVYSIAVELPPLPTQRKIVKILDDAFEKIGKAKSDCKKNSLNISGLFSSILNSLFSGDPSFNKKKINEIAIIRPQKNEIKKELSDDDFVTFLPMSDLKSFNYFINPIQEQTLSKVYSAYTYFKNNDVLIAKITPCFENGKMGIAQNLKNGIGFGSSEYIVLRCKGNVIPEYIYYYLSQNKFRDEGSRNMQGAVGHKRIAKEWFENYKVLFPTNLKQQKIIVSKIDNIKRKVLRYSQISESKTELYSQLKQSILQKAFNGELTT